jgi:hypothetical protein
MAVFVSRLIGLQASPADRDADAASADDPAADPAAWPARRAA